MPETYAVCLKGDGKIIGRVELYRNDLAVSLAGKIRIDSVLLGWIDINYTVYEGG